MVNNPTEVEELITVNIYVDNLKELDIIKEHVKNVQNSPDVESPETAGQWTVMQPGNDSYMVIFRMME